MVPFNVAVRFISPITLKTKPMQQYLYEIRGMDNITHYLPRLWLLYELAIRLAQ